MTHPLDGKTAIVTGATSGIGLAIAEGLAAEGAAVVINGLGTQKAIAEAVGRIQSRSAGGGVHHRDVDLRNPDEIEAFIHAVEEDHGAIDILVNNAGIQHTDRVEDFPREKWDEIIAVNLSAVFHATAAVLPGMKARDFGRIINIASIVLFLLSSAGANMTGSCLTMDGGWSAQ